MTRDEDEVLDPRWPAIEQELRRRPRVDPAALDRVMAAVRSMRMESEVVPIESAQQSRASARSWATRRTIALSPLQAAAAVLILAVGAGWMGLRLASDGDAARGVASGTEAPSGVYAASNDSAHRPVQFVFVSADAREVSLVGSFNDWDMDATPLKLSRDGVWSVEVPLAPGRHVYSFVVDGKQWVPDAAAPRAPADELGISNSIVYVGQGS